MLRLPLPTSDTPSLEQLIDAIDRLSASTTPGWGKMDALAMLEHCSRFVDLYLGRVQVGRPMRLMARLLGPLFLRRVLAKSPMATPRNLRTLGEIKTEPGGDADLEAGKERLRSGLREIAELTGACPHVLYGSTEAESLRSLVRHHTAHHFHQFGLLG